MLGKIYPEGEVTASSHITGENNVFYSAKLRTTHDIPKNGRLVIISPSTTINFATSIKECYIKTSEMTQLTLTYCDLNLTGHLRLNISEMHLASS